MLIKPTFENKNYYQPLTEYPNNNSIEHRIINHKI